MKRIAGLIFAIAASSTLWTGDRLAVAQPARGAGPAFERLLEVMRGRFNGTKLVGDPDKDFTALLIAHHEDLVFLAKTQLEYGGDRQLRQLAQKILDEQQKQIAELKEWQVRNREPGYRAQPDQAPHGTGPLDKAAQSGGQSAAIQAQSVAPSDKAPAPAAIGGGPMVAGTVEKIDEASGKITLEHGPIPNLNMDAMRMVFQAGDKAMLRKVRRGDKIKFTAERVNGRITVTTIEKTK